MSLWFHARLVCQRGPFRDFGRDVGGQVGRATRNYLGALLAQLVMDLRRRERHDPSCNRVMMGIGVPEGANRAYELSATNPGNPASAVVGMSGMIALRRRLVTASARRVPART